MSQPAALPDCCILGVFVKLHVMDSIVGKIKSLKTNTENNKKFVNKI